MEKGNSNYIRNIRNYLKSNILNDKIFYGHEEKQNQILDLLEQTIKFGESNSALIIGPRGCGKTAVSNFRLILH